MVDGKGCTCGSGAHPRKCDKHPYAYRLHIAELNLFQAVADGLESTNLPDDRAEAERWADKLINEFKEAVLEKERFIHNT